MGIQLVQFHPAGNKKEFKRFIDLAWTINSKDPAWIPPLRLQVIDNLDTKKNPFYKHAKISLWNAYKDGKHVGRIAGIVDDAHNEFHSEKTGFWGFFECINDSSVAKELFAAAEKWAKDLGMNNMRGPANPSLNHECGLVINKFERAPYVMMTHNPSYYPELVEQQGNKKAKDLLAFEMESNMEFPEKIIRVAQKAAEKASVTFRSINMKDFMGDVKKIQGVYNSAWEKNWGFVPMNDEEFTHMGKSMKDIVWPDLCLVAESNGKAVGFSLALPDINQVLKTIPNGKLLPFGIIKLLRGISPKAKKINQVRVITLGVIPEFRATGVASLFYLETYRRARALGVQRGEMSWILEDNQLMVGAINVLTNNLPPYKTFRLYDKPL